jgi:hypothetical protein
VVVHWVVLGSLIQEEAAAVVLRAPYQTAFEMPMEEEVEEFSLTLEEEEHVVVFPG